MKRILTMAFAALMTMSAVSLSAQGNFKGIVKYEVSSVGTTPVEIRPEMSKLEVKVMNDKVIVGENSMQSGRTIYSFMDLSQLVAYASAQDFTFESLTGTGKVYVKRTLSQLDIDSLTIPVSEGFYIEYKDTETKQVAGIECKKAVLHIFGDDGQDQAVEVWYAPDMGPEASFVPFSIGTKGLPLEFVQQGGDGKALKYVATEVTKGKVKDVDFLMPAGYKEMTEEQMEAFGEEYQEFMELMGE